MSHSLNPGLGLCVSWARGLGKRRHRVGYVSKGLSGGYVLHRCIKKPPRALSRAELRNRAVHCPRARNLALLSSELGLFGPLFGLVRGFGGPHKCTWRLERWKVWADPEYSRPCFRPSLPNGSTALTSTSRGILTLQGCKYSGHTIKKPRRGVPAGQENS